jgi:cytochrome c oxidase assembly protein Cox11
MRTAGNTQRKTLGRDLFVASLCAAFVALMGGLSYAAVPLYSWFCRASSFGRASEVAGALPGQQSPRLVTVRFDSDFAAGVSTITLFYTFYPVRAPVPSAAERRRPPAGGPERLPGRI